MSTPKKDQVELAKELQDLWLKEMKQRFLTGEITSTDMATLARLLRDNGWTLDPADLPSDLRDKLTAEVSFDEGLEENRDLEVVP